MDDLQELLTRIAVFAWAYRDSGYHRPLFRLTPYEHELLRNHLVNYIGFVPEYYGHLPHHLGTDFQLVGKPVLFDGKHIRGDSGIELEMINDK